MNRRNKVTVTLRFLSDCVDLFVEETHILLKLCKGFADAVLHKDHSLPVGQALHRLLQGLCHRVVEQRPGGRAVDVAGGESGNDRCRVHVDGPEQEA